jgi:hypothetical protein
MPVLSKLTTANTVFQMMGKVNQIVDNFQFYDSAAEIVFVPNGTITANNVQMAIIELNIEANTATTILRNNLVANVATLNTTIDTVEQNALATAVALSIALG